MKYLFLTPLLLLLLIASAVAQPITGRIADSRTHAALPYVNIGVIGKDLGTVADEQGHYTLAFQKSLAAETVRISSLGYAPRTLTLAELAVQPNVALTPEAVPLAEVQVKSRAEFRHTHTLGNTTQSGLSDCRFSAANLGWQVGTVIRLRRRPSLLVDANFVIKYNTPAHATFRVNLYRLDANGLPTETKLLTHDLIVTRPLLTGPMTIDLRAENLVLDEDFLLAVELLDRSGIGSPEEPYAFSSSFGYLNNGVYRRSTSQATWTKSSSVALMAGIQPRLSFYVTVND
ncbi:hypothetical protein ACVWYF_004258 [Hymenobacter sp. UYAg731]